MSGPIVSTGGLSFIIASTLTRVRGCAYAGRRNPDTLASKVKGALRLFELARGVRRIVLSFSRLR